MTSDAKIGLLLGLVFIFIIAFIINGLPKLRGETDSNELTTNMARNEAPGLAARERRIEEEIFAPPSPPAPPSPMQRQLSLDSPGASSVDNGIARYRTPLPGASADTMDIFGRQPAAGFDRKPIGPILIEDQRQPPRPAVTGEKRWPESTEPPKLIRPVKPASPKTYVVSAGDNLGVIAKKFYGAEQGNRVVNVTRIFEANRKLLKSPDGIYIGQKLIIPALPAAILDKAKSSVLGGSMFEPAKSVGQRHTAGAPIKPELGRFYIVKDGDSLWKISTEQLDNGARFKEIAQLNSDILPNADDLKLGMRLKMPAK